MFQPDKWPFTPVCLSEIIGIDNLSVIESGCCERLERPLTILDYDPQTEGFSRRIESINEKQRYEAFCRFLRDEKCGVRGGDMACKRWDIEQAKVSLEEFQGTGDPFRTFQCYMGLQDMTHIIRIRSRPVALLFSGQYAPQDGVGYVHKMVQALGAGSYSHIELGETEREQLFVLARELPPVPRDARSRLEREATHIQRIAEAEFERRKRQWEQDFLDKLRRTSIDAGEVTSRDDLQLKLRHVLELAKEFCRCEYAVFFGSVKEGDTGLAPIAESGVSPAVSANLPHFNWKKAGLPSGNLPEAWDIAKWQHDAVTKGLRGENSKNLGDSCIIPMTLGDRYRGVLALGPFAESVDVQEEHRFLTDTANTIGLFGLTGLEVLYLERERRRWESTATLLTHQLRTGLTPITAQIGRVKTLVQKGGGGIDVKRVSDWLGRAEDLALLLAQGARKTLEGHVLQVEPDDLELERYPLSVIVENCAAALTGDAQKRGLELVIDSTVELLPEADVDVARFTIALANLIDNAIKYSFSDSKIIIRSHVELAESDRRETAVIEIDDIGLGIREEDEQRIFEQGTRGLTAAKMGHIPGSGLGLWEARAVVTAHDGKIRLRHTPTAIRRREGQAHHVTFAIEIPLPQLSKQKGRKD